MTVRELIQALKVLPGEISDLPIVKLEEVYYVDIEEPRIIYLDRCGEWTDDEVNGMRSIAI